MGYHVGFQGCPNKASQSVLSKQQRSILWQFQSSRSQRSKCHLSGFLMRVLCFFPGFQEPQTFLILLLHHPSLPCYSPPVCGCIHIPPCIRTPVIKDWGFPGGAVLKITLTNGEDARDAGLIPVSERSPGEGNGNPLQYSFLENPTDRGAWQAAVYGITKNWTWLSDWTPSCRIRGYPPSVWPHLNQLLLQWPCFQTRSHSEVRTQHGSSDGKESACSVGTPGSIPGLGRSPGGENGYPFQYSCLENSMDRGAWWATVHGVAKSRTWLSK